MRQLVAIAALALLGGCANVLTEDPAPIFDTSGAAVSEKALTARLATADIVILGEVHDNPVHHARQAQIVRALAPAGVAFEMVPEASEEGVQALLAEGSAPREIGPAIGWERMGWPEWDLYAPIFEAAPGAYIAGAGVPRAQIRKALRAGAAAAYGPGASEAGLTIPFDQETLTEVEDEMIASHCNALPREVATGMVEAQRLRDARFARAVLRARQEGGGQAVLITGNGHARTDRGVPAYLRALAPELTVLSVGMIEAAEPGPAGLAGLPYDFVWVSAPHERADPCEGFS